MHCFICNSYKNSMTFLPSTHRHTHKCQHRDFVAFSVSIRFLCHKIMMKTEINCKHVPVFLSFSQQQTWNAINVFLDTTRAILFFSGISPFAFADWTFAFAFVSLTIYMCWKFKWFEINAIMKIWNVKKINVNQRILLQRHFFGMHFWFSEKRFGEATNLWN